MNVIYKTVIYGLVLLCGGCAVNEVIIGGGTVWGLGCVLSSLAIIVYIVKVPVEAEK